jgi:hypothetical protein
MDEDSRKCLFHDKVCLLRLAHNGDFRTLNLDFCIQLEAITAMSQPTMIEIRIGVQTGRIPQSKVLILAFGFIITLSDFGVMTTEAAVMNAQGMVLVTCLVRWETSRQDMIDTILRTAEPTRQEFTDSEHSRVTLLVGRYVTEI